MRRKIRRTVRRNVTGEPEEECYRRTGRGNIRITMRRNVRTMRGNLRGEP